MTPLKHFCRILATVAVAAACWMVATPVQAQESEAAFYKGKTVRILVGYGPGGGYDTYARMIAPYLGKALGATVVVENMPGAGGIAALDHLVVAPKDGLEIMNLNGTAAALGQLTGLSGVRYDLAKLGYLGTVTPSLFMWLVTPNSPIKIPQDVINAHKPINWAASGLISVQSTGARFTCAALNLDCHVIMGYKGSDDTALAVSKGEMDAMYVTDTSANHYAKAKEVRAIAAIGHTRSRFFPEVPTIFQALKLTSGQDWLFDYYATLGELDKILVAPPNLPATRLAFLQAAVKRALANPALVAQGERTQFFIDYRDAKSTRAAVLKVLKSITPEQRLRIKTILTKNE